MLDCLVDHEPKGGLDWCRFWWDCDTDHTFSFADQLEVWDEADPHTWHEADTGDTGLADYPAGRIEDAMNTLGHGSIWTAEADNGVDR